MTNGKMSRLKVAELTSGVGALILGIGLGAKFSNLVGGSTVLVIVCGALMHGWGMFDKHRIEEKGNAPSSKWESAFYWLCWALLIVLFGYLVVQRFSTHV